MTMLELVFTQHKKKKGSFKDNGAYYPGFKTMARREDGSTERDPGKKNVFLALTEIQQEVPVT